jgi:hypothetical protein
MKCKLERIGSIESICDKDIIHGLYKINISGIEYYATLGYGPTINIGPPMPEEKKLDEDNKHVNLIINGHNMTMFPRNMSYREIVDLAHGYPEDDVLRTITFNNGKVSGVIDRTSILSMKAGDRIVVDCVITGNA